MGEGRLVASPTEDTGLRVAWSRYKALFYFWRNIFYAIDYWEKTNYLKQISQWPRAPHIPSSTRNHASRASIGKIMPLNIIPSSTWEVSGNFLHAWFAVDRFTETETSWGTYFDFYMRWAQDWGLSMYLLLNPLSDGPASWFAMDLQRAVVTLAKLGCVQIGPCSKLLFSSNT